MNFEIIKQALVDALESCGAQIVFTVDSAEVDQGTINYISGWIGGTVRRELETKKVQDGPPK